MLARVLIVIVVVAILGFFGTRGSEKVVEEVTTRQAVVDTQGEKIVELTKRIEKDEAALAASEKLRGEGDADHTRTELAMQTKIAVLERGLEEVKTALKDDGQASLSLMTLPRGSVTVDGKIIPNTEVENAHRFKRGPHTFVLTDPATKKKARWKVTLNDDNPENRLVLLINGQSEVHGGLEATTLR